MALVIALEVWLALVVAVMLLYAVRHGLFTLDRLFGRQRPFYQDLLDGDLPGITVLIPMHNEEAVVEGVLYALARVDYPPEKLEIIPIDDHSTDATPVIIRHFAALYPTIRPLFRRSGPRGKPAALNEALAMAKHEIVVVFDADYQPWRGLLRELALAFLDPEVGAVMGRVVPHNAGANLLTRLLDLERSGGYQVDQQARYSLDLIPQYGGTVGGFRKSLALSWGGFSARVLAEDTDMTFRLYIRGWRVAYANRAECYEEAPETWAVRFKQLRRWARGHDQAMLRHVLPLLRSQRLRPAQKLDGLLLLGIYLVPPLLLTGLAANLALFLVGAVPLWEMVLLAFFLVAYNAFGNFAPFYEVSTGGLLDRMRERLLLLPFLFFLFQYNSWAVTLGLVDAITDTVSQRAPTWDKTARFRR